jgi:hypothetical protein
MQPDSMHIVGNRSQQSYRLGTMSSVSIIADTATQKLSTRQQLSGVNTATML